MVPENGLATTTVPGDVPGGGVGESVRKRGWICASVPPLPVTDGVVERGDEGIRRDWLL